MLLNLHKYLSSKVLEPAFWSVKRMPVMKLYNEYSMQQFDSIDVYNSRQNEKLSLLLTHVLKNIPYYRDILEKINVQEVNSDPVHVLRKLPILTKQCVRNNFNRIYIEQNRGSFKNKTGGSTGEPFIFYQDKHYQTAAIATTYLMYEWAGKNMGDKLIKLWGAERDLKYGQSDIRQKINDFIGNRKIINSFIMSPERMQGYINLINQHKPVAIEGYVNALYDLSKYIKESGIKIFSPDSIMTSTAVLHEHMRCEIESAFGAKCYDRYGSRDAGNIAAECNEHNGLHIFGETSYIEIVDEAGNEVEEGQEGTILVTNLYNYTMPLLRYKIGDRAIKGGLCKCGRPYPLIKSIIGREGSSFRTKEGGYVPPIFFLHLIGVMYNDGSINKYQVQQLALDHIKILIKSDAIKNISMLSNKNKIEEMIHKTMGQNCRIDYELVEDIETTETGKYLYTINLMDN